MVRKLAHVERVKEIIPIENADRIELAKVLGWQCVVKKGDFKPGDMAVYFEIDSYIPIEPRFEFLRSSSYKKLVTGEEGFKLRTVKLRGKLSQGLLMPVSEFTADFKNIELVEGTDVTETLKITIYEPPIPANLRGKIKGHFPYFIQKTDQERIQNLYDEYILKYKDIEFEATEKLDGTSCTYYFKDGVFGVCGRGVEFYDDGINTYWIVANKIGIEKALKTLNRNIAVQGELIGESIQGDYLKIKGQTFNVYDIYDIDKMRYLTRAERMEIYVKLENLCNGIKHVPVIDEGVKILDMTKSVDEILDRSTGESKINPTVMREGVVYKSTILIDGAVLSFKAVDNRYLLAEKEETDMK